MCFDMRGYTVGVAGQTGSYLVNQARAELARSNKSVVLALGWFDSISAHESEVAQ